MACLAALAGACGDTPTRPPDPLQAPPSPGVSPAVLVADSDTLQDAAAGQPVPELPVVLVEDAHGNGVAGHEVEFVALDGGTVGGVDSTVVTSAQDGRAAAPDWVLGPTAGTQRLEARAAGLGTVTFIATASAGRAAQIAITAGAGQSAEVGHPVAVRPAVTVRDSAGNPVAGVAVGFAVTAGGGGVSGASVTTDAAGVAVVGGWTLGPTVGLNRLTATAGPTGTLEVTIEATATAAPARDGGGYTIELRLNAGVSLTAGQQAAFDQARARWESVITGDLPDVAVNRPAGTCGSSDAISDTVDDLLVIVEVVAIDGVGGVLGSAGPCMVRSSRLTLVGRMRLDLADLVALETNGRLAGVVLHEMGHVIGIGTLWSSLGLLADPVSGGGTDPHFTGSGSRAAFDAAGGASYTGATVPVERLGGDGTADGHWRESVFDRELMTGWIDSGSTPLSSVTVQSLADLGYTVDGGAADGFSVSVSTSTIRRSGGTAALPLPGDIEQGPIEIVDRDGTTKSLLPPGRPTG